MSELFSIQLQNRQQQGRDGVWLDLPTTTEQVQAALRQIGISSDNPQGLFISGFFAEEEKRFAISYNMVLASNVDELNFLASRLETLSTGERAELNAALQAPQSELFSIGRITDFPENVDLCASAGCARACPARRLLPESLRHSACFFEAAVRKKAHNR